MFEVFHGRYGETYINIWDCRATLARDIPTKERGVTTSEYCTNADEIYEQILEEIDRQGGAINMSGRMPCPPELAALAQWGE